MIEQIVILSLIITAIHVSMKEGMIFAFVGAWLSRSAPASLQSPLHECLTCMGGVYSLLIYPLLFGLSWMVIPVMIGVIGLNSIIDKYINNE